MTQRRLERSVASQSGCAISAFVIAGVEIPSVICRRSIASSVAPGSNSRRIVAVAPAASPGVVRMFSGPVLNSGPLQSTSSAALSSTAAATFSALWWSISWVSTAPFVGPVVPEVLMTSSGVASGRSGSQRSSGAPSSIAVELVPDRDDRRLQRPLGLACRLRERGLRDERSRLGVGEHDLELGRRHARAQRDEDRSHARAGEQQVEQLGRVVSEVRDPVALGDPRATAQRAGEPCHPLLHRLVGDLLVLEPDRDRLGAAVRPPGDPARDLPLRRAHVAKRIAPGATARATPRRAAPSRPARGPRPRASSARASTRRRRRGRRSSRDWSAP